MATITAAAGGGNWSAGGTWVGGVAPTAADDAVLDGTSGNVTIDVASACRSLDCSGYTGTLTHTAAITLSIGTSTPGTGNRALRFSSTMTYTLGDSLTSSISFVSTSTTQQTIDFSTKTVGPVSFTGVGGSWLLASNLTMANLTTSAPTLSLNAGTFDTGNFNVSVGAISSNSNTLRTISFGSSTITVYRSGTPVNFAGTVANLTFNAGTSNINTSAVIVGAALAGGGKTFYDVSVSSLSGGGISITGNNTFHNLTISSLNSGGFLNSGNQTITGTLNLVGQDVANRLFVGSNVDGTQRTLTAANVTAQYVNFADTIGAGAASWNLSAITGGSGNIGNNSGITFTTPSTQTWSGTSGGVWTANAWSGRVPLPQDTAIINAAFTAGQSITFAGGSRFFCGDVSFVGATGNPTFSVGNIGRTFYGSITLISGMTFTSSGGSAMLMNGRGNHTITTAGKTVGTTWTFNGFGGTYTLQDDFTNNTIINHTQGTLDLNNHNVTSSVFNSTGALARTLNMGSGTWNLATGWSVTNATGLTFNCGTSTIKYGTSASTRTFAGAGLTYYDLTYNTAGSTGELDITGSNTFHAINFSDVTNARTLAFTAGTTTTITGSFNVNGTSGKLMTIGSITAANHTLSMPPGNTVNCNYLSISRSKATGGAVWFANTTSTDGGNNSGWIFGNTLPPASGNFFDVL